MGDLVTNKSEVTMSNELTTNTQDFELRQRKAAALAKSSVIPKEFQNNLANCVIAIETAERLRMAPFLVLQNLYIVHGKPAWSSSFLIAQFNQCGKFSTITYSFFGEPGTDGYGCYAKAIELQTGEIIQGPPVTIAMAKKEGWHGKNGSKWQTMPDLMLRYRAATFLVRTTAPELTLGYPSQDEVEDIQPQRSISIESLQSGGRQSAAMSQEAYYTTELFDAKAEQPVTITDERSSES